MLDTNGKIFEQVVAEQLKAGTDYETYSAAQPDVAAKNMMFANVDSQQTCCEHAMSMFRGRAVLPQNEPKIVSFQDEHKGIPCHSVDGVLSVWCSCKHRLDVRPVLL